MGFKSEDQRRGFFGNLRASIHEHHVKVHEAHKEKLQEKIMQEQLKLQREQKRATEDAEIKSSQDKLQNLKDAENKIKKERFDNSHTGKFINASKKGISAVVKYEREHAKGQINQLRKLAGKNPVKSITHVKRKRVSKKGHKVRISIKESFSKGFLTKVSNPKGTKPAVYISQGKNGFTAKYTKSNKAISGSSKNAESLARKLAKKGHKTVTFRD